MTFRLGRHKADLSSWEQLRACVRMGRPCLICLQTPAIPPVVGVSFAVKMLASSASPSPLVTPFMGPVVWLQCSVIESEGLSFPPFFLHHETTDHPSPDASARASNARR
jgi:hypothetical protein